MEAGTGRALKGCVSEELAVPAMGKGGMGGRGGWVGGWMYMAMVCSYEGVCEWVDEGVLEGAVQAGWLSK